jgi:hypothetical protein
MFLKKSHGTAIGVRLNEVRPKRACSSNLLVKLFVGLVCCHGQQSDFFFQIICFFLDDVNVEGRPIVRKDISAVVKNQASRAPYNPRGNPVILGEGTKFSPLNDLEVPEAREKPNKNYGGYGRQGLDPFSERIGDIRILALR